MMSKINTLLFLVCVLLMTNAFSQNQQSLKGTQSSGKSNMPKVCKVFGKVTDDKTKKSVDYATVAVISLKDSSLTGGGLTNTKGEFKIEELPYGKFKLRITFIGYLTLETTPFTLAPDNQEYDAGIIHLTENTKILKQAEVTAEKSEVMQSIDKKVYNVDKNIVNIGGTVIEVLAQIPSVNVDMNGAIQLRGSQNVTILIDGKPSSILGADQNAALQQIPGNAIDQIEVITNPSAKYDAEGMAGIINIVTKKEKMRGMNFNATAGVGTNNKYNAGLTINNRTAKANVYGNYSFRSENRTSEGEGTQLNYLPSQPPFSYTNINNGFNANMFNSGKLGCDFYLNNYNTLGVSGSYSVRNETRSDFADYTYYDSEQIITDAYTNIARSDEANNTGQGNFDFKHLFPHTKRELTVSGNYSINNRKAYNDYYATYYAQAEAPYQKNVTDGSQINSAAQADYVHPFTDKGKLETGIKAAYRKFDNDVSALVEDSGEYINDARYTDKYIYDDQVYAAYGLYTGKINTKFDFSAGLRAEGTVTNFNSLAVYESFQNNYINLFPTATLKYKLKSNQDLQLSYSRRINRPSLNSLNPFTDYSDTMNLRTGNPDLDPEKIHSIDLSHSYNESKISINTSVFYRHTDDLISRIRTIDTITGVTTMMPVNYSSSENIGMDLSIRYQIGKLGSIMLSGSGYYNIINGSNISPDLQSEAINWNSRLSFNIRVMKNTNVQITGFYMGPMKSPTSVIKGMMNGVDMGVKQDLFKGKASISLNVTDVFDTRKFSIHNYGEYFDYNGYRKRESRVAMLTFQYRFGKQDTASQKKGSKKTDMDMPEQMNDF